MQEICGVPDLVHLAWITILIILVQLAMASGHISMNIIELEV